MGYWRELPQKIQTWRKFKNSPWHPSVKETGKVPSETYVKYGPDSTFAGKKTLNLGCGTSVYNAPNVINLDAVSGDGVNVVHDLSNPKLPFDNETFDIIIANHVLEHIPNWWELFKDLARVLKTGGTLEMWIPPVSSDSSFTYRDHINSIGILSFAGSGSFRNPGCNLVVGIENKKLDDVAKLIMVGHLQRPYMKWWLHFAPTSWLTWMTTHLRNTVTEEGFFFKKTADVN